MFDESNLHSLIARESEQRNIPLQKLIRESLEAAADGRFAVRSDTALSLSPNYREELRRLAAFAEAQRDWHWWQTPPWSDLKLLLVPEANYLAWLDQALRPTTEAAPIGSESKPKLKPAPESKIDQTITEVYDEAAQKGSKPPNIKEIAKHVQAKLHAEGYRASARQIQSLAKADKHKGRRRARGRTVASDRGRP
jgi:hypothetical protein